MRLDRYTLSKDQTLKMHTELKLDNMKLCQVESIKIPPEKRFKQKISSKR